ncbi:MAG TPA: CBS domain-containing protein [Actinomadura sp.]|jgi:CBS domain-containing membrane protein|nr:CBS domain-containing protein [Actinomadura sp.]
MDESTEPRGAHRPLEDRAVADVMTIDLLTVDSTESVLMAWELMHQARCHHLPVVDDDGRCLGVLNAETIAATWEAGGPERARKPVAALLHERRCPTVSPDERIGSAARNMLVRDADHVAVTDSTGRLVGLLTATNLITALAGVDRPASPVRTDMPSLYRIEPVLPEERPWLQPADEPGGRGPLSPD